MQHRLKKLIVVRTMVGAFLLAVSFCAVGAKADTFQRAYDRCSELTEQIMDQNVSDSKHLELMQIMLELGDAEIERLKKISREDGEKEMISALQDLRPESFVLKPEGCRTEACGFKEWRNPLAPERGLYVPHVHVESYTQAILATRTSNKEKFKFIRDHIAGATSDSKERIDAFQRKIEDDCEENSLRDPASTTCMRLKYFGFDYGYIYGDHIELEMGDAIEENMEAIRLDYDEGKGSWYAYADIELPAYVSQRNYREYVDSAINGIFDIDTAREGAGAHFSKIIWRIDLDPRTYWLTDNLYALKVRRNGVDKAKLLLYSPIGGGDKEYLNPFMKRYLGFIVLGFSEFRDVFNRKAEELR